MDLRHGRHRQLDPEQLPHGDGDPVFLRPGQKLSGTRRTLKPFAKEEGPVLPGIRDEIHFGKLFRASKHTLNDAKGNLV